MVVDLPTYIYLDFNFFNHRKWEAHLGPPLSFSRQLLLPVGQAREDWYNFSGQASNLWSYLTSQEVGPGMQAR